MGQKQKLEWLEMGRGVAALAVFVSHGSYANVPLNLIERFVVWGEWGVAFFFVLSGFIIFYVHSPDLNNPARASNFAWRRFIRIFPTYWLVLSGYLVFRHGQGVDLSWEFFVKQFLLLPGDRLFLPVAWTLRHELLFYAIFLLAVFNIRLGIAAFATWIILIIYALWSEGAKADINRPTWDTLTSHLNLYFFFGMAIAKACLARKTGLTVVVSLSLSGLALAVWLAFPTAAPLLQLTVCGSLVALAVHLSIDGFEAPPLSGWLGAISYPLYLVHLPAILIAHSILKRSPISNAGWPIIAAVSVVLAIGIAALISRYFEKPIVRGRKERAMVSRLAS